MTASRIPTATRSRRRRRHPRGWPAGRPAPGPARACRAGEPGQAHDRRHHRRRDGDLRLDALGLHPRAGIQGQTKDKLATVEAQRIVETAVRDAFDHWLAASPAQANKLLDWVIDRAEERLRRRQEKEVARKSATRKLRLPGKLADCSAAGTAGSEIFIVEGDSAGAGPDDPGNLAPARQDPERRLGEPRQARRQPTDRRSDAGLGLRHGGEFPRGGPSLRQGDHHDGRRRRRRPHRLAADHLLLPADAQAHRQGHLYLAIPPLYRIQQGSKVAYARDDADRERIIKTVFKGGKVEIGRFKGLGEMMPAQLKETTMDPKKRTLLRVAVLDEARESTGDTVERLMGNKPEARFTFITERAAFAEGADLDI
ncbi:hypothetical protein Lal_00014659 [Lupinus albus]|nr:hypothetical protein Lal_00014659 [Lupinus albus]